jgi:hypothetical protein
VLRVVPGVGLVRDEVPERGGEHRQVGVDGDAAAQVSEVVVEPGPRLVGHQVEVDVLTLGQAEGAVGALPEVLRKRGDGGSQLVDGDGLRLLPRDVALGERSAARHDLLEGAVCSGEDVLVDEPRGHAVAPLDLLDEGDSDPGEPLGSRPQAGHLGVEPSASVRVVGRVVEGHPRVEVGEQAAGVVGKGVGPTDRLGGDAVGECGRAVVGVDEAVDVASEAEPELEVALDEVHASFERKKASVSSQPLVASVSS